jgi:hypothetical protein
VANGLIPVIPGSADFISVNMDTAKEIKSWYFNMLKWLIVLQRPLFERLIFLSDFNNFYRFRSKSIVLRLIAATRLLHATVSQSARPTAYCRNRPTGP